MEVVKGVRSLAWLLAACVMPYTIMATFEGILVAGRDSNYLAQAYSISGLVFLLYQEWVRRNGLGLQAVWLGLAIFQWVRLAMFGVRLKGKMKR